MIWPGALQKTGTLQVLRPHAGDVKAVTIYTHTIVLGRGRLADDREDPFFTASGNTPEEAEQSAYTVYLRAINCHHHMKQKAPMLLECSKCGVQKRGSLPRQAEAAKAETAKTQKTAALKPQRRLFGLL